MKTESGLIYLGEVEVGNHQLANLTPRRFYPSRKFGVGAATYREITNDVGKLILVNSLHIKEKKFKVSYEDI